MRQAKSDGGTNTTTDEPLFPTSYTVTIKQLCAWLAEYPDDTPVVMSKDGEGNGFSPLSDISTTHYHADTTWGGEIEDQDSGEGGDDGGVRVVCLWPVN